MPTPLFKKGNPGGPGRDKGSQNKVTKDLVAGVLDVFEKVGGWEGMVEWLSENPRKNKPIFYNWILKMLPSNVNLDGKLSAEFSISELRKAAEEPDGDS